MPDDISIDDDLLKAWKSAPTRRQRYDVDSALDLIAHHESGGRNIKQQIVPEGGGFNPSVGKVTGPSTASGPWQITNSTWRKRAPREITEKYPTAISAPVEVQRAVAGKIFRETGFQDWAPYNASLRRAIARGEQPRRQTQPQPEIDPELLSAWTGETQPSAPPITQPSFPRGTTKGRATGRAELVRPQLKTDPAADLLSAVSQVGGAVMRGKPAGEFAPGTTTGIATSRNAKLVGRQRTPQVSRADIMRAEERPQASSGTYDFDPRLMKGEQPLDPAAYAKAQELVGRVEPIREVGGIRAGATAIGPRDSLTERIGNVVRDYAPGIRNLDTPMGVKTDPIRGAASLGLLDLRREITPEERLLDPQAEAKAELAYQVGSFAPAVVPYAAAGKVISKIPALNAATREAHIARSALTFGGVELGRELVRSAQTGEPLNPKEVAISTAIGGGIGGLAGVDPSLKRQIVAFITPGVVADVARGSDPQTAVSNAFTNLLFGLHSGTAPKPLQARGVKQALEARVRGEGRETTEAITPERREAGTPEQIAPRPIPVEAAQQSVRPPMANRIPEVTEPMRSATNDPPTQVAPQPPIQARVAVTEPTDVAQAGRGVPRPNEVDAAVETPTVVQASEAANPQSLAVAVEPSRGAEVARQDGGELPQPKHQWQHRDFGRVEASANQTGVGRGRVRVTAEDGSEHVIQRANLRGQGNNLAVPVRETAPQVEPDGLLPVPKTFPEGVSSDPAKADYLARQHPQAATDARDFQELSNRYYDKVSKPAPDLTQTPARAESRGAQPLVAPTTARMSTEAAQVSAQRGQPITKPVAEGGQKPPPSPQDIQAARKKVADDWRRNAEAIRREDEYADHVEESTKDKNLADALRYADEIEQGTHDGNFTIGQRVHYELTGESVPFLPPTSRQGRPTEPAAPTPTAVTPPKGGATRVASSASTAGRQGLGDRSDYDRIYPPGSAKRAAYEAATKQAVDERASGKKSSVAELPPVKPAEPPATKPPPVEVAKAGERKPAKLSLPKSLEKAGLPGGKTRFYDVKTNVESEDAAKRIIKERGIEGARNWVQAGEQPSAEQSATALELIKGLAREAETAPADVKAAKLAQAGDLASTMAVRAKEQGQAIQYLHTLAKESPEGAVYYAESRIKRQSPDARLTPEQRNGMFDTAVKLKATEAELESTRTKLADVEKILSERASRPRGQREPQVTTRLREWADQAEKDARARLAARTGVGKGGETGASTIPSDIADYAVIGAAKIARGTADFAAWSSQMVDEFGEGIKPQLRQIRTEAERLVSEQSQLARKGKVVDEIARLGTDPRVVESAKKFAAGMSRTDFHRYARERYNLTPQQANDLAGRAYKTYTQANQNLRQAGKERRAERDEPDASPERKAELIAQRDSLMRQRGKERRELASMMRQIEEGRPKITARLNNQFRGIVVSALGTASRNVTTQVPRVVVEDMTKAFELAFVKGKAKLGWRLKEGDADPRTRMLDTFKSSAYLFQRNKRVTEGILDEFPVEYENLFRRFSSDVDITPQTGVSKGIHKGLDKIDKGIEIINTPNRFQEFLVRRAVFRGELEAVLRAEGVDLNKTVAEGRQGEIDRAKIQKAVNTALRVTFADSPARGTMGDAFIKFTSSAPAPINPLTFSRFLYNGAKFTLEYQPTTALRGLYRTARGKPGAASDYAKAAVGTVMLTTAVGIYDNLHKDSSEWYLLNVPGVGEIDIRAYQPFASYVFAAHWARTKQSGKPISYEGTRAGNVGTYVEGLTGLSARPVPVYEVAKAALSESQEWDGVLRQIKRVGGETVAGLLTPLKMPKQIIAQFDKEEAVVRDASQSPFTGPIRRNIPFASRTLPPLVRNEEVVTQPLPALQLAGIRTVMPDKRTEAEKLAQKLLRRDYTEARTDEEITRGKQTADLRTRARRGETVDLSALPPRQRASIEKSAGMTRPEETFKRLGLEDLLLNVWPVASEQEREIIKPMLAEKADRVDNVEPFKAQLRAIGIVPVEELSPEKRRDILSKRRLESREQARARREKQRGQPRQRPSLGYGYN